MEAEQEKPLKKDVIITIASRQNFDGCEPDRIDLITAAPESIRLT